MSEIGGPYDDIVETKVLPPREKGKGKINWKALIAATLALMAGGKAVEAGARAVHDSLTTSPAESFEKAENKIRMDQQLTQEQKDYLKNMDEIIRTSTYKGDVGALYSMVHNFQKDKNAQVEFEEKSDEIEELIVSKKIGTEKGASAIVNPIKEKFEMSERGELGYSFTGEEAKYRAEAIGDILSVENNMPDREKAELASMVVLSEDFSFNRYNHPDVYN